MTSLLALIRDLEALSRDDTVFAASPWTPDSDAACLDESGEGSAPPGLTYFLEVDLIHDVAEVWSQWRDGRAPTAEELTEAAIHYAENDAYLPADDPGWHASAPMDPLRAAVAVDVDLLADHACANEGGDLQPEPWSGGALSSMEAHVASWLGEPRVDKKIVLEESRDVVSLLRVDDSPCDRASTLATAGLADLDGHRLHEELVVACWSEGAVDDLALVVELLVRQLAEGREPLLYGDVVGPAGPLVPGSSMEAIYVCEPIYHPSGFARFTTSEGCEIRTRWLIPIHAAEARLIGDKGAAAFEDLLEEQDPDLLSLQRGPVALGVA